MQSSNDNIHQTLHKTVHRRINLEMMRFFGYVGGIMLLLVGTFVTSTFVQFPYEGEGFDWESTFIYKLFGFNHTCATLDFNPSRTISAITVMFSVAPLLVYIILNRIRMEHEFINGNIGPRLNKFNQIITPLQIIAFAFFYLVFVNQPMDLPSFILHYIPYMNYQIGLGLIEVQQVEYLIQRKKRCLPLPWIMCKLPAWTMRLYSIGVVGILIYYTIFVWSFIAGSPIVDTSDPEGVAFAQFIMYTFLVATILIPAASSFMLINTKYGSLVSIDCTTISHIPTNNTKIHYDEESGTIVSSYSATADDGSRLLLDDDDHQKSLPAVNMSKLRLPSRSPVLHTIQRVKGNIQRPPPKGMHPTYKIKNVVFQGGGSKCIIFTGAIHALDEVGVLPYLQRFAGTSAGCIPALFLALGLDATQVREESNRLNLEEFFDGKSKTFNLLTGQGMHPGNRAIQYVEEILYKYTGDPNLTFLDLYQRFGTELCISVSNISRSQAEYLHVITSPDMKISHAIRASMSLPLLWQPIELYEGETYVDGGVFNNYALKAFDGWFLSTKKGDSVMEKTSQSNERVLTGHASDCEVVEAYKETLSDSFVSPNNETIGFRIAEAEDQTEYATYLNQLEEKMKPDVIHQHHVAPVQYPNTPIARAFVQNNAQKHQSNKSVYEQAYVEMLKWMIANLQDDENSDIHPGAYISSKFVSKLLSHPPKSPLTPSLFDCFTWDEVIGKIDTGKKGYITVTDMGRFWGNYHIKHAHLKNRDAKEIKSKRQLISELINSMHVVFEENLLSNPDNAVRTCTLQSHYVRLLDLSLEQSDKEFLYKSGRDGTLNWLQHRGSVHFR